MKMIKGLYETHLFVENLEVSIDFYKNILGLEQCYFEKERRAAFFWIGKPKEAMLGLWEKPKLEIDRRHFAFRCDTEFILNEATDFLKEQGLNPFNFLNDGSDKPMVFSWVPAIAIYFDDPDGHHLEFIAVLDGKGKPEHGIITYEKWLELKKT
jgi:catechol 2,3-dioxygenase-like lactoylglutathione lyase family enzyme